MFALNPCVWRRKDSQNTTAGETLVQAHAGANTWCKHTLVQAHVCPRVFPMVMTLAFSNRNDKHSISNVLFYTLLIRTILGMHRSAINWESQQSTPGRSGHNRVARPATTAHCAVELFPYLAETISLWWAEAGAITWLQYGIGTAHIDEPTGYHSTREPLHEFHFCKLVNVSFWKRSKSIFWFQSFCNNTFKSTSDESSAILVATLLHPILDTLISRMTPGKPNHWRGVWHVCISCYIVYFNFHAKLFIFTFFLFMHIFIKM